MRRYLMALLIVLITAMAHAHGPADWIGKNALKNGVGELCCGERDCGEFVGGSGKIVALPDGYHVHGIFRGAFETYDNIHGGPALEPFEQHVDEIVPYNQAQPSPDGIYWRCQNKGTGERRCFFAPPPGS